MNITHYLPELLSTVKEPRLGHLAELERRALQSFADVAKLENLPNLDALRLRLYEKQFGERLGQTDDRSKKVALLNEQRKLRANYAGAVLRTHEIHYDVQSTWNFMAILLPGSQEDYVWRRETPNRREIFSNPVMSNYAALAMLHKQYCTDADATAKLIDSVAELEPGAIQLALRSLFDDVLLAEAEDCFAEPLDLTFINLHLREVAKLTDGLQSAYAKAATLWGRYETARAEYISAKANLNEPQFASRTEQAIRSGSAEKEREVEADHDSCRLHLYCATMICHHFFEQLTAARAALQEEMEKTVAGLNGTPIDLFTDSTLNEFLADKVRNNCICARVLISKMNKPGPRPDLSRLDDKIFAAVQAALNSFEPLLFVYRASMLASLG